jgi:hypothetical protein
MRFLEDQWTGNQWASIDILPVDMAYFLPILEHLSSSYNFPLPNIIWDVDGYVADFEVLGSEAIIKVDTWTFSIAFQISSVRDQVLAALRALPPDHFR